MNSSTSSPKHTERAYSEEIAASDLFYQLTHMSAMARAGIPRGRLFGVAAQVRAPCAKYFEAIIELADKMRYGYSDACLHIAGRVKSANVKSFLLRLADALRSGEPLAGFLVREAEAQGNSYENEYERDVESMKKWNDGYTSVSISVSLIVIINMVTTMIYPVGPAMMAGMTVTAIVIGFLLAWVVSRAAPKEVKNVSWSTGSPEERRAVRFAKILVPLALIAGLGLALLKVDTAVIFMVVAALLLPVGILSSKADSKVDTMDAELSPFFRSLGGTASSKGTTLGEALASIELDSFPALKPDIRRLMLRLRAGARPDLCWERMGPETGSSLVVQSAGVFYEATNAGGDPAETGVLCSLFSSRTAMLRAKRKGAAGTFSWLTLVMHGVVAALMVFMLEILRGFIRLMEAAQDFEGMDEATREYAMSMMSFNVPPISLLETIAIGLLFLLCLINGYAIIATEGSHILKLNLYFSMMLFLSGISLVVVPPLLNSVM